MHGLAVAAAVLLAGASARAGAESQATALEFLRVAPSIQRQTSAGPGSYDVLKVFDNPAWLVRQPQQWSVGFSDQLLLDGAESVWGAAAGWASAPAAGASYALALMGSGLSSEGFEDLDLYGNPTGTTLSSGASRFGLAAAMQMGRISFGASGGLASETVSGYTGPTPFTPAQAALLDAGVAAGLGHLDGCVAYHFRGGQAADALLVGAAFRLDGTVRGSLAADMQMPLEGPAAPVTTAGVMWQPLQALDVRAGAALTSLEASVARLGLTLRLRGFSLDYAFSLPLGAGTTAGHMFGIGYGFGAARNLETAAGSGGAFSLGEKERTVAVANFDAQNVSAGDAAVISDLLRSALVKEAAFNIVEKANMDKILGEQAFQQTGCTTQECAVKLGKVLNVNYLVVGSFGKTLDQYLVAMRVVDVQTARIVYSDEAQGANLEGVRSGVAQLASRLTAAVRDVR